MLSRSRLFFSALFAAFLLFPLLSCFSGRGDGAALFSEGLKFYALKDLDRAEELFTAAAEVDRDLVNAPVMLAKVSYFKKDFERGAVYADRALKRFPHHSGALYWKARCLIMAHEDSGMEAAELLKRALESDSGNLQARQLLGLIYEREGLYKEALHHYFEALKDEEVLVNIRVNLALLYCSMGLADRCNDEFDRAVRIARAAGISADYIDSLRKELR